MDAQGAISIKTVFLNDWAESSAADVFAAFDESGAFSSYRDSDAIAIAEKPAYQGVEILLASYSYQDYSGGAFVLFRKDGKLFEVNGGHCSCYGLEDQWDPEETTVEALRHRLKDGTLGMDSYCGNEFATELAALLDSVKTSEQGE